MRGYVSNTVALCFVLGWQGGTVHQVAAELQTTVHDILDADDERMGDLLRMAQRRARDNKGDNNER